MRVAPHDCIHVRDDACVYYIYIIRNCAPLTNAHAHAHAELKDDNFPVDMAAAMQLFIMAGKMFI